MGYRASKAAHRIYLAEFDGSDNWVDVREGRSSAAAERYRTAGMHVTGIDINSGTVYIGQGGLDLAARRNILFQQAILAWSLKAEDGDDEVMPLRAETYDQLPDQFAEWLEQRILAYYAARRLTEEQVGNSNGSSTEPSAAAEASR